MQADVTPADVLRLREPTPGFLCPLSANIYNIDFLSFTISDYDTKKIIFEVNREKPPPIDFSSFDEESLRKIRYKFSEDVLRLPAIRTELRFSVGNMEVPNFRMIERHYHRDKLIKSYDFTFGFCIPNSVNTWDAVYAVPPLDERLVQDMVQNPHSTQSDSFYFVNDRLVMHNKASYSYIEEDRAQAKRSYDVLNPEKPSKSGGGGGGGAKAEGKYDEGSMAEAKGGAAGDKFADGEGGGSKASSKYSDDAGWSKESDYYD